MIELVRRGWSVRPARTFVVGIAVLSTLVALPGIAQSQVAVVSYVEGEVWIERDGNRVAAQFGDELSAAHRVVTGAAGVAIVRLNEESSIKLRSETAVLIGSVTRPARIELDRGGVFARVARQATEGRGGAFQLRARTVVAGVRGTEFFVAYGRTVEDAPDVWLCVNEGEVDVSVSDTGASTVVREGEGVNILAASRVTDPRFYDWTTQLNWSFDPAAGEVKDTTDLDAAYSDLLDQDYD